MLTRLYVEALLANENLADQVWELWNAGLISEDLAAWAQDGGRAPGTRPQHAGCRVRPDVCSRDSHGDVRWSGGRRGRKAPASISVN